MYIGSVTVMTVTLAFKAFAKAIPCLTPFLATSDPSVLKRILAYIWWLPCSSNMRPPSALRHQRIEIGARFAAEIRAVPGQKIGGALSALQLEHLEEFPFGVEL